MSRFSFRLLNWKLTIAVVMASIASLATFPYGYRFVYNCGLQNTFLTISLGILFAICATLANSALGTYSLIKIENQEWHTNQIIVALFSLAGSIPVGFICFFGYKTLLPTTMNILLSLIVVIVNSAIGFTAMRNVIAKKNDLFIFFKQVFTNPLSKNILNRGNFFSVFGISVGLLVSTIGYLATVHGINDLFVNLTNDHKHSLTLGFVLAIFAWLPSAALYAYANFTVFKELQLKLSSLDQQEFQPIMLLGLMIFLFSGTAFAEIAYETINYTLQALALSYNNLLIYLHNYLFVPLALLSSAAVNYFAIMKLLGSVPKDFIVTKKGEIE